jgi:hypothetical protein
MVSVHCPSPVTRVYVASVLHAEKRTQDHFASRLAMPPGLKHSLRSVDIVCGTCSIVTLVHTVTINIK